MTIYTLIWYLSYIFFYIFFISKYLKNKTKYFRISFATIYFVFALFTPFVFKFIKNNLIFLDKNVIAEIFMLTAFTLEIILFLETKFITPKVFFAPICSVISAIYNYIKGLTDKAGGDIVFVIITLIITLKYLKPVIRHYFKQQD